MAVEGTRIDGYYENNNNNNNNNKIYISTPHSTTCPYSVSNMVKNKIVKYTEEDFSPYQIKLKLESEGIILYMKKIYSVRRNHNSNFKNEVSITTQLLKSSIFRINSTAGDDEVYVAGFSLEPGDTKFMMTSRKMIHRLSFTINLHVYSTFKLIKGGYPVIVVGVTDNN
ncbi:hypothetical protein AYI68_g837 [Smittium mucronatum]|uniref:Uncharacterized protein n=1 Tax=Smittium mucronatum TaxID=133383 RepID=A0A1R0H784_9FUNG|nr:hypothetical protein AYI68_g837 [Smittium mucronatum]